MMKQTIKKCIHSLGWNISRFTEADRNRLEWLKKMDIRTILDIGANRGQFACSIHEVLPGATLHSFEPLNDCFLELQARTHHIEGMKYYNCALGEEEKTVFINRNEFSPSSSFLLPTDDMRRIFPYTAKTQREEVRQCSLDGILENTLLERNVLIKIDVQGYEQAVIAGGRKTIGEAAAIIVETSIAGLYEGQPLFEDIFLVLRELGFSYSGNLEQMRSPKDGSILEVDAIFINNGITLK